jgi:ribosomal protein L22
MTPDEKTPMEPEEGKEAPASEAKAVEPKAAKKPVRKKAAKAAKAKEATAESTPAEGEGEAEKVSAKKAPAKKASAAKKAAAAKEPVAGEQAKAKPARAKKEAPKAPRRRVVAAHARYVRTSARKARMVCGHIRGKSVQEARAILAFTPREVARDWSKLLESAVANAESNHELLEDDLVVREAYADEGPTIKRFRPRAMGRATPIRKRTSHLTITLTPAPEPGTSKRHS